MKSVTRAGGGWGASGPSLQRPRSIAIGDLRRYKLPTYPCLLFTPNPHPGRMIRLRAEHSPLDSAVVILLATSRPTCLHSRLTLRGHLRYSGLAGARGRWGGAGAKYAQGRGASQKTGVAVLNCCSGENTVLDSNSRSEDILNTPDQCTNITFMSGNDVGIKLLEYKPKI